MIEIFQCLGLEFQRFDDGNLAGVVLVTGSPRYLHLLDGDHLTRRGVEGEIHLAVSTLADKLATNPTEYG